MPSEGPAADGGPGRVPRLDGGQGPRGGERPACRRGSRRGVRVRRAAQETPVLGAMLADLAVALEADEGQKLGGKSAEAARFILRAISRELDNA